MASEFALQRSAQAWTTPETSNTVMDTALAKAFADILDDETSKPLLGNATTGELLDELRARAEVGGVLNYRTVDGDKAPAIG